MLWCYVGFMHMVWCCTYRIKWQDSTFSMDQTVMSEILCLQWNNNVYRLAWISQSSNLALLESSDCIKIWSDISIELCTVFKCQTTRTKPPLQKSCIMLLNEREVKMFAKCYCAHQSLASLFMQLHLGSDRTELWWNRTVNTSW